MTSKPIWMAAGLTAAALLTALPGAQAGNCNNYGIAVNTYVFSPQDCSSHEYVQYCDQGTGAGAGAGAGSGYGSGEAGASATAGTKCEQNNSGNQTSGGGNKPVGGPTLDKLFSVEPLPSTGFVTEVTPDLPEAEPILPVDALQDTPDASAAFEALPPALPA